MRTKLDCIPCFQRQVVEAAKMATSDEEIQENILRKVMKVLYNMDWGESQLVITKKLHEIVYKESNNYDPYREVKRKSNEEALRLYSSMKKVINSSNDLYEKIRSAIKIAIAGNIIDFGPSINRDINKTLEYALSVDLDNKTFENFIEDLDKSDSILYFADNCGEIVFDKLLIECLGKRVFFVVKKSPILNDATIADIHETSISKMDNVEVVEMEVGDNINIINKINPSLIISKGQGNYEALSERGNIYFMLIAKCQVIAKDLGVPVGSIVFKKI